jgi:prolyl-tRNA synthetase
MMQDNRALQAGTSHNLGQNFARQFDLKFQSVAGGEEYAWNTSWGVSTRLVGGLVMTHGDDAGLIVPPQLAPIQVVVVPIFRSDDQRGTVLDKAHAIAKTLKAQNVRVHVDARDGMSPGAKYFEWERKGVPVRIEVGPKDIANQKLVVVQRRVAADQQRKEVLNEDLALATMPTRLQAMQNALLAAAVERREANSYRDVTDYARFREIIDGVGGFVYAGFCGSEQCEEKVKEDTKATVRCLPFEEFRTPTPPMTCLVCGAPAQSEAVWAKAY